MLCAIFLMSTREQNAFLKTIRDLNVIQRDLEEGKYNFS